MRCLFLAAAAVDKLQLGHKRAVSAYEHYPRTVKDPVDTFMTDLNKLGELLTEDHKAIVFKELPVVFKTTSKFYAPLAKRTEPVS